MYNSTDVTLMQGCKWVEQTKAREVRARPLNGYPHSPAQDCLSLMRICNFLDKSGKKESQNMPNCQPRIPLFLHQYLNFIICSHVSPKRNDSAISIFRKILKELANSQRSTWREKMIHHVIILNKIFGKKFWSVHRDY